MEKIIYHTANLRKRGNLQVNIKQFQSSGTKTDTFSKKTYMANRHMKKCLSSLISREMQTNIMMHYFILVGKILIKRIKITSVDQSVTRKEFSYLVGGLITGLTLIKNCA